MEISEKLFKNTLKLFPEIIDISDGELRGDGGLFSQTLSNVWRLAEKTTEVSKPDADFMIFSIFRLLHKKDRENYAEGIYSVSLDEIDIKEIKKEY